MQAAAALTLIPHALPNSFFEKSVVIGIFFETQASRSGSEIRSSASDAMNTCTASPFSSARIVSLSPTAKAALFNSSNFMISPAFARTKSRATLLIYHPRKNLSIKFRKISDAFAIFFTTSPGVPMAGHAPAAPHNFLALHRATLVYSASRNVRSCGAGLPLARENASLLSCCAG
jgi:hypothetical protein